MTALKKLPTPKQLEQRVARGAKLLDKREPGWYKKVKFNQLDMVDQNRCVLGQVYGDAFVGADALGLKTNVSNEKDAWAYFGFDGADYDAAVPEIQKVMDTEAAQLAELWKNMVRERKNADKAKKATQREAVNT